MVNKCKKGKNLKSALGVNFDMWREGEKYHLLTGSMVFGPIYRHLGMSQGKLGDVTCRGSMKTMEEITRENVKLT
jgi:hypothetical protein